MVPKNYCTIWKIDLDCLRGYREEVLLPVKQQFRKWFPNIAELEELSSQDDREIQATLLSYYNSGCIIAGLSLRCYISHVIVYACQKMVRQFGDRYGFSLPDILYIVLTDDGNTQNIRHHRENSQSSFTHLWEDILKNFDPERAGLWSFTYVLTRRHPELTERLREEYGLSLRTPWSILNNIRTYQMETLSLQDRNVVEVFHEVYRRDRRENGARGTCPDPSESQLQEMRDRLLETGIVFNSIYDLKDELQDIVNFLEIQTLSLDEHESDPPATAEDSDDDFDSLTELVEEQRDQALMDAIAGIVSQRLQELETGRYREFAPHFLCMLRRIYCENRTQTEIAQEFNIERQDKVSRILEVKEIYKKTREQVMDTLLLMLLEERGLNSSQGVSDTNAFDRAIDPLSQYLDKTVFTRPVNDSLFAQKMCSYLCSQM